MTASARHPANGISADEPVKILEIDIGRPLQALSQLDARTGEGAPFRYRRARVLVRLHTWPLGLVMLPLDENLEPAQYAPLIWEVLGDEINEHLVADDLAPVQGLNESGLASGDVPRCLQNRLRMLADPPLASVVVCTRDRPQSLAECLQSLFCLTYPNYEIVIVDNAPSTSATAELVHHLQNTHTYGRRLRYVCEKRPGLVWARNCGIAEARGVILAYTDDDVIVDEHWLSAIVEAFRREESTGCVTGLTLARELDTPPQIWFEQYGGFSKGFRERAFHSRGDGPSSPLYPYATGAFGSGNNFAFKTDVIRKIGGFNEDLCLARAADDLSIFFEVIMHGFAIRYCPAAIVHHTHRRDYEGLKHQMYWYGVGLTAYLASCIVDRPRLLPKFLLKLPFAFFYMFSSSSAKNSGKDREYPAELTRLERQGALVGPYWYLRGRMHVRAISRSGHQQA